MEIIHIPKPQPHTAIAHLILTGGSYGANVTATLSIERAMQSSASTQSYGTVEEALERSTSNARQQGASVMVVHDRT